MKKYNRTIICAFAISMSLAFAVPAMAYADETDVQHVSEWVTDEKGRIFYYDESGKFVTGEQEIDGEMYLFSKNGVQKTGWRTVDGARKYYDTETGKPVYGWIDYCGKQYYIEKESKDKQVNCVTENEDGKLVLLNDKGSVMIGAGFTELDDNIYFVSDDGTLVTGETVIDDVPYVFDNTGKCGTGWQKISGKKYYYNPETAEPVFGFFEVDGSYYYTDKENGMCTSVAKINGIEYLFNEQTGKMQYGWLDINDSKRYFYKDATYAKGLTKIDGESYIFSDKGVLLTGFAELEGNKYYLDEKDGKMHFEWLETNGKKYYFNGDTGIMMTGRLIINGGKYYFAEDGSMQIGLQEIDGKKYYFNSDTGIMMTGRLIINGGKYYFAEDGSMQFGLQEISGDKYYFAEDGKMVSGWQEIDGKKYYFNETSGKMEKNKIVGDYNLTADGSAVPLSAVQQRAKTVISQTGTNATNIYNYVRNNNKYSYIENTRTLAQIESQGWSYFANYALDNRFVVCYYFAAVTDLLYKQAGYETRIVYGTGTHTSDHYWNQVYVNGQWLNYDTCNGYCGVSDAYLKSLTYTWTQFVYPKYY